MQQENEAILHHGNGAKLKLELVLLSALPSLCVLFLLSLFILIEHTLCWANSGIVYSQ